MPSDLYRIKPLEWEESKYPDCVTPFGWLRIYPMPNGTYHALCGSEKTKRLKSMDEAKQFCEQWYREQLLTCMEVADAE